VIVVVDCFPGFLICILGLPDELTIKCWPAHFDEAKKALLEMRDTHTANYINAYDVRGRMINPENYRKMLQGAIVQMRFTMTHFSIGAKKNKEEEACDTYIGDIDSIRVVIPPKPVAPSTPKHRRINLTDPVTPNVTPMKKLRESDVSTPSHLIHFCSVNEVHLRNLGMRQLVTGSIFSCFLL
jgi:hypothetical protein